MEKVLLESPWHSTDDTEHEKNREYVRIAIRDSLSRGEAPFASHALYGPSTDDNIPHERSLGLAAGQEWYSFSHRMAFYMDRGFSAGMVYALAYATQNYLSVEFRFLEEDHAHLPLLLQAAWSCDRTRSFNAPSWFSRTLETMIENGICVAKYDADKVTECLDMF